MIPIFFTHNDPDELARVINEEFEYIDLWMKVNKLSVNTNKTNYILFKGKNKKIYKSISIIFDKTQLVQKQSIKFLGVVIDENLSWKLHISYICKKISKSTGIIFRCRYYLSTKTKLSLYYTLVYPYLTYCNIVWSSNYKTNLKRIYLLQKRIVRALTNSDFRAHTAPLFTQLKILDIYKINAFHVAKFMFSYHHRLLPPSFHNLFITSHQVHSYNTRSSNSYRSHLCKTNTKQFTILFQGPKIWNSLPNDILKTETLSYFRSRMLNFLLES
jgi:hypothetical protein